MYDRLFDYQFEEALSDLDRVCDWDENDCEVRIRPVKEDDEDEE